VVMATARKAEASKEVQDSSCEAANDDRHLVCLLPALLKLSQLSSHTPDERDSTRN
jgi:hypothetical protein